MSNVTIISRKLMSVDIQDINTLEFKTYAIDKFNKAIENKEIKLGVVKVPSIVEKAIAMGTRVDDIGPGVWLIDKHILFIGDNVTTTKNMCLSGYLKDLKVTHLEVIGGKNLEDTKYLFYYCKTLHHIDLSKLRSLKIKDMSDMFRFCYDLKALKLHNLNTSNVEDMSYMFFHCRSLEKLNISNFDTTNVKSMVSMFEGCKKLKKLDISNFRADRVDDIEQMFMFCTELEELNIKNFKPQPQCSFETVFEGCDSLNRIIINRALTSNFTELQWANILNAEVVEGDTDV